MKRTYHCPHCGGTLNPNVKIVIAATNRGKQGLLLFSPRPGNYDLLMADDLDLQPGDTLDLACPICRASLTSSVNPCLAEVDFRLPGGNRGRVDFSRKVGEQATYVVTKETIRSFGDHAERYMANFFGSFSDD